MAKEDFKIEIKDGRPVLNNEQKVPTAEDHPSHYCDGGIETIDYIRAKCSTEEFAGFCKGNALKYISRAGKKTSNAEVDIQKAIDYLEWWLDAIL